MSDAPRAAQAFARLVEIMATLRGPGGCPWDREQTIATLQPFVLEETYEVVEAIDRHEHEVAELFTERGVIARVDRLEQFVGFFEHERLQRVDRLLAIPRAAVGPTKSGHDVDEACERLGSRRR